MKKFFKAAIAAFCSLFCVNTLCIFYYSAPGDIYRNNGATDSIRMPDSRYINASEGYGIIKFDKNGYNNLRGELASPYVLIMGSSHMEAIYVSQEANASTVLNYLLGGTDAGLRVYNIAHANNSLPSIIKGFQAGIGEFPDSCAVIIEIYSTSFSTSELQKSLQQTEYETSSSGAYLSQHLTGRQKLRSSIIGSAPFAKFVIGRQFQSIELGFGNPFGLMDTASDPDMEYDEGIYVTALNNAFLLLRNEYDNPIIILYHPAVELCDNTMRIIHEDTYDVFRSVCESNGIIFCDTGDAFLEAYEDNYVVPYGFNNTAMGYGHLNNEGHKIIANELYQVLQNLQEVSWQ